MNEELEEAKQRIVELERVVRHEADCVEAAKEHVAELERELRDVESDLDTTILHNIQLQDQLAEVRENLSICEHNSQVIADELRDERAVHRHHCEQLAEAQAHEAALRAALIAFVEYADDCNDDSPELDHAKEILAQRADTSALSAAIAEAVEPIQKAADSLCSDMEAIAAGAITIPAREYAMHALADYSAALAKKGGAE